MSGRSVLPCPAGFFNGRKSGPQIVDALQSQQVGRYVPDFSLFEVGGHWPFRRGLAVLKLAEVQASLKDPNCLGVIAIAPPGAWEALLGAINASMFRGYAAFVAFGLNAVYPDFEYADLLTPAATKLMPAVKDHGWEISMATFAYQVPPGQMLRADWKQNRRLRQFAALSVGGAKPARGPVLLLAGLADETVPAKTAELTFQQLRGQGTGVEYRAYPGLDHDPLVFGSFRDQVRWVEERFAGKPFTPEDHSPGTRR